MPLAELAKCFVAIDQLAAFCLSEAMLDLCGNVGAILGQPLLVLVKHLDEDANPTDHHHQCLSMVNWEVSC